MALFFIKGEKMIKKFVLDVGRAVIDLLLSLMFAVATIAFFIYVADGADIIYAVLCCLLAILVLVALFYTIYLFVDIRDTLKEIRDKVSNK